MSNALRDFAGALRVVTCAYYPLVYLSVAAALRGLDPAQSARSLGESAWDFSARRSPLEISARQAKLRSWISEAHRLILGS